MQAQHSAWRPLPPAGSCIGSMHGVQAIGVSFRRYHSIRHSDQGVAAGAASNVSPDVQIVAGLDR